MSIGRESYHEERITLRTLKEEGNIGQQIGVKGGKMSEDIGELHETVKKLEGAGYRIMVARTTQESAHSVTFVFAKGDPPSGEEIEK